KSSDEQKKAINESLDAITSVFREARAYWLAAKNNIDTTKRDIRYEAMRRVFDGTMPVIINAGSQREIEAALDFATEFSIKVIIAGGYDAPLVADRLVKMHVPVIVQRVHSLPQRDDSGYDEAFTIAARLHAAGVKFCLSDGGSWQQRNLPFQAGTAIAYGLSPDAALASITLAPAQIFGIDADYGSLEAGKSATLFLSSGDALDGVSIGVERAWIDGREIDLSNRHKRLSTKYRGRYSR
ncbi:MAG: amidohydrolase, partial [Ignavibacteriae bacterium]